MGEERIKEDENQEGYDNPERNDPTFNHTAHRLKYGLPLVTYPPEPNSGRGSLAEVKQSTMQYLIVSVGFLLTLAAAFHAFKASAKPHNLDLRRDLLQHDAYLVA